MFYERRNLEVRLAATRETKPAVACELERSVLPACDKCLHGLLDVAEAHRVLDEKNTR